MKSKIFLFVSVLLVSEIVLAGAYSDGGAWAPSPPDGAEEVPRDAVLSWRPGDYAVSHDVYLWSDFDKVNDADRSSRVFVGNQPLDANSFDPGGLPLDTTFYWRIDEVGDSDVRKGYIWRFRVAEYVIVDDMESYCPADLTECGITETWIDGIVNFSGATIQLRSADNFPVHGGKQSMEFWYDNDGEVDGWPADEYSEIERTLDPAEDLTDWTVLGLKALRLYFYGHPWNDTWELMYVGLEDYWGTYAEIRYGDWGEDVNDIRKAEWQQWNIGFVDFWDVDLGNVRKIYIGFGDRDVPRFGGAGVVYFDDIRLYMQTCVPYLHKPAADLNNDCIVDLGDLRIMAREWLDSDAALAPVEPDPAGLRLLYKFDESGGTSALDSSGNDYHGTLDANGADNWDLDGKFARCLNFDETFGVTVPSGVFSGISNGLTIGVWVNGNRDQNDIDNVIFQAGGTGGTPHVVTIRTRWQSGWVEFGTGVYEPDRLRFEVGGPADWAGEWNHYAFVKDASAGTMKIYHNGLSVAETAHNTASMSGIAKARIGAATGRWGDLYVGKLDDLRIYNYALLQAEIASIMGLDDLYIPLRRPEVDLCLDGDINFRDYAVLVNAWLERRLWPPE